MILAEHGTFHHVYDFDHFELPFGIVLKLPNLFGLQITKFMVLQVVAVLLVLWIFSGLSRRIREGKPASGWWWGFWEMLAIYIRDELVRPIIGIPHAHGHHGDEHHGDHGDHSQAEDVKHRGAGHGHAAHGVGGQVAASGAAAVAVGHPADKYLPFIWSCFFFILISNLLGAIPFLGSATGHIAVTIALALAAFVATYYYGAQVHGYGGFIPALVPTIDAPKFIKIPMVPMMFVIELVGFFIKHGVLAVRLFANIMGGHTVLGVILGFIAGAAHSAAWWIVTPGSILGQVGVGLLELLVAFIQAYVFTFLSTIFIGMTLHEH